MILYHGTSAYFDVVKLGFSRDVLDFGNGFYTTSDINQARTLAFRYKQTELSYGNRLVLYNL